MKTYLKIKIKSLAAEAVIIKREEQKWKHVRRVFNGDNDVSVSMPHPMFFSLKEHRLFEVRTECRAAILAYGYLRGRSYKQIEAKCHEKPNWTKVINLVSKYGNLNSEKKKEVPDRIKAWAKGEDYKAPGIVTKIISALSSVVATSL